MRRSTWVRPGWSFVILVGISVPGCWPLVPIGLAGKAVRLAVPLIRKEGTS